LDDTPPPAIDSLLAAPQVGVVLQVDASPPATQNIFLGNTRVGVTVGPVATGLQASALRPGVSGTLTVSGVGLDAVSTVGINPANGFTLGTPSAQPDGLSLSIPITLAANTPAGIKELKLSSGVTSVLFTESAAARFIVASNVPRIDSITPIIARQGDTVTLIAPSGQVTPAGVVPRLKQMKVVGTFDSGHFEYDSALVMLHQDDAAKIFRLEGPTGIRIKLKDLHQAREVAMELSRSLSGYLLIRDWTQQNKTWFAAVQLEKRMMFIILTLIVAVAAFNLVSTLVMTVTDKRADIAILRTLGASPKSIMGIFVVQGAMVGVIGTLAGLLLGLGIAFNIDVLVPALERLLNANFLPKDIYLISRMPSEPQYADIMPIAVIALILSFLATLYPSWRASRVNPAEALRYE